MAEAIFWLCLLLPLFAYLGYPLLLAVAAPHRRAAEIPAADLPPRTSVLVAAHNEARNIEAKLRSLLEVDYPHERLQIIVASDGSTDATVALAQGFIDNHDMHWAQVLDLPRGGKAAALNGAVAAADGEILVFSDADTLWMSDTLEELLAPFVDPGVGATSGNVTIASTGKALAIGDQWYRAYESWLRRLETRNGCMASADGGLLALRRSLFQPIPANVTDDFFLTTCAPIGGQRIVFTETARVLDQGVESADNQFRRRQRITTRGLQSLAHRRTLLDPRQYGLLAIGLICHKLVRRLAPLLLVPLLLSSFWLWDDGVFYQLSLLAQLAAYGVAVVGLAGRHRRLPKPFRLAAFALVTLAAMGAGIWRFVGGQDYAHWNPQQNR